MRRMYFCEVPAWSTWDNKGFWVLAEDEADADCQAAYFAQFYGEVRPARLKGEDVRVVDVPVQLALF